VRIRVTLADVAARAGTSKTTAHYVLTGRDREMRISDVARRRVQEAAADLGYRPNLMARGLRTDVTRTIALVTDTVASGQFAGQLVYGSLVAAAQQGHLLVVCETDDDPEIETRLVEELLDRRVDGFVLATSFTRDVQVPEALTGSRVVLLNCRAPHSGAAAVLPAEVEAGHDAVQVLLDAGHREGIWVVGEAAEHVVAGRERGPACGAPSPRPGSSWPGGWSAAGGRNRPSRPSRPCCWQEPDRGRSSASTTASRWAPTRRWPRTD
jgi:LacI family transcriptional regulator